MTAHHLPPARIQLLQELAHTYGTPLYVYDMPQIARNFTAFKQNFSGRKSLICYALKANSNLSVLRLLAELGSGADCVSIGEVRRALLAGIPAYKIIFSGVGKRDEEIREALELGILFINVESFEELKRVEAIAKSLVDSALGERVGFLAKNGDCGGEPAVITAQGNSLDSPCKAPFLAQKSCREQNDLESTFPQNAQKSKKVDSSNAATLNKPAKDSRIFESKAQNVSEPQAEGFADDFLKKLRFGGFQGAGEGIYLGDNEQARAAESAKSAAKPTPKPNQAQKPQKARISIRVNPNIDAKTHPYISTGLHENKFGVDMDSAKQMYLYAHKSAFLEPIGIHFHIGSQLTELEPLVEASRKIANLARSLVALGINLRFFDIGGGLGIRYEDEKPIDLYDYAQGILSTLSGCDWTIVCEPGRRIVGDSGLLLTRVISQKHTESKRFVIVDAGMNDLMRPALYGAFHQPIILQDLACRDRVGFLAKNGDCGGEPAVITTQGNSPDSPCKAPFLSQKSCREQLSPESTFSKVDSSSATTLNKLTKDSRICDEKSGLSSDWQGSYLSGDLRQSRRIADLSRKAESTKQQPMPKADIVGPVCESSDTFCKNIALPPLHNGALLAFSNAGAYGYSMASTYNARMRPAEVGIYADGARLIKSRESFEASVADELALLDSSK